MKSRSWPMLMIVICAFFFVTSAAMAQERMATIQDLKGEVFVKTSTLVDWTPAEMGMTLAEMDQIKTGSKSKVELYIDDAATTGKIEVGENSIIRLNTMEVDPVTGDKNTLLDLAIGKVIVRAEKLEGQSKFEIRTPTSTTGVRGTLFEVEVE